MIEINDRTEPTVDKVKALLEQGKYEETAQTFAVADLGHQYFALMPAVWRHRGLYKEKGFGDPTPELVAGHRLLELGGYFTADRLSLVSEQVAFTDIQVQKRKVLIAARDVAVRLARNAGADPRLFSVNFGQGEASNVLAPSRVFLALLEKHGARLNAPTVVDELKREVKDAVEQLTAAEIGQETRRHDQLVPGALARRARNALYGLLLRWSRLGFAITRHLPEEQAMFSLTVLRTDRRTGGAVVADDDDAPVLPVSSAEAGVDVPTGTVASIEPSPAGGPG